MPKTEHRLEAIYDDETPSKPIMLSREKSLANSSDDQFIQEFCEIIRLDEDYEDYKDEKIIREIQFK